MWWERSTKVFVGALTKNSSEQAITGLHSPRTAQLSSKGATSAKSLQTCITHPRDITFNYNTMSLLHMGVDILGPIPISPDKVKFLIVGVKYFTKWVEPEPIDTITVVQVKKFYWKNITIEHYWKNIICPCWRINSKDSKERGQNNNAKSYGPITPLLTSP